MLAKCSRKAPDLLVLTGVNAAGRQEAGRGAGRPRWKAALLNVAETHRESASWGPGDTGKSAGPGQDSLGVHPLEWG